MKKRLLFFGIKTFPSRGGTDRVAENLIAQLHQEFEITLYCFKDPLAKNHIQGIRVIEFPNYLNNSIGVFLYFLISSIRSLFTKYDIVHAHKTDCAFFIPILRLRNKVIATSHEAPYLRDKWNFFQKLYFKLAERFFIYTPNQSTSISKPLSNFYERKYKKPVPYIPNGIRPVVLSKSDFIKADSALPEVTTIQDDFILFSARRLMSTKGCHTFLEAMKKVKYKGHIFIAGEDEHHTSYLKNLHKLADGMRVHFLGFVHPLETLLAIASKCRFFVFPSEVEGMSIMLLEVASLGKPIIASNIPENQVFEKNEVLFFETRNVDDLAEKIQFALDNPDQMEMFGKQAQDKALKSLQWEHIATRYSDLYRTI